MHQLNLACRSFHNLQDHSNLFYPEPNNANTNAPYSFVGYPSRRVGPYNDNSGYGDNHMIQNQFGVPLGLGLHQHHYQHQQQQHQEDISAGSRLARNGFGDFPPPIFGNMDHLNAYPIFDQQQQQQQQQKNAQQHDNMDSLLASVEKVSLDATDKERL